MLMKSVIEIKKIAKDCIAIEHQAIEKLQERIDDNFVAVIKLLLNTKGRLIIAGIGYLIWAGPLDALAGLTTTLERFNFLPEGTTNGLIAFWGKLRGFITLVLWGGILFGIFWVMNMVFGAAKTAKGVVDAVTDNIVPDAEPSGA